MQNEKPQPLSPAMSDPETIRALAQINKVRALFPSAPAWRRRPTYTLPATPAELKRVLWAEYVTPQHLVFDSCTVADVVAEAIGTDWYGVYVTTENRGRTFASASSASYREDEEEDGYPYPDPVSPMDDLLVEFPLAGVLWTPELAKLAAYLDAREGVRS